MSFATEKGAQGEPKGRTMAHGPSTASC